MTALWWIRRDLRLRDNRALQTALALGAGTVIPIFVRDPDVFGSRFHRRAARRQQFLDAGLVALDADLRERGSRLVVREGRADEVLAALAHETSATAVVAERDHSPFAKARDAAVERLLPLHCVGSPAIRPPGEITKADGSAYAVFGAFRRAWLALPSPSQEGVLTAPAQLPAVPAAVAGDLGTAARSPSGFPAGEIEAQRRLEAFTRGPQAAILRYAEERDRLDHAETSALSPYFHLGMISAREAAARAAQLVADGGGEGPSRWLDELIWRDFYLHILDAVPETLRFELNAGLRQIAWRNDPAEITAWQQGRTGYPIVDAAMRQLVETGWMHNRARMIVASFLVKHLLVDWRVGEAWFMEQLLDGDPASNNGGWQWVAGTGTDAAPYFRVFNPVLQGKKFDPDATFIRRWLPELRSLRARFAHEPWELRAMEQAEAGLRLGVDYPARIVDLGLGRARALQAFGIARK